MKTQRQYATTINYDHETQKSDPSFDFAPPEWGGPWELLHTHVDVRPRDPESELLAYRIVRTWGEIR